MIADKPTNHPAMNEPAVHEALGQQMEKEIRSAARRVIAKMARIALEEEEPATAGRYQNMLAKLALAQVALAYPRASLGVCMADGTPIRFEAKDGGLYVCCCSASGAQHGWKIDC